MTREEYYMFRLEVQSKTNGANVHYINGKLGLILNSISILEYVDDNEKELIDRYTKLIPECIKEINIKLYPK